MFKSSRKKLIAIGCSYTEDWNSFPAWPTVLAEKLDMDCVNLGKSGAGNDQILARTVDTVIFADGVARINKKDIGLVVLMWSEWQRLGFQQSPSDWNHWWHIQPMRHNLPPSNTKSVYKLTINDWAPYLFAAQNPHHITQHTFRNFIHAEKILQGIPHLYVQGCLGITWYNLKTLKNIDCGENTENAHLSFYDVNNSRKEVAKEMIRSPYFNYLENNISKHFIGWPIMPEIGGYSIDDIFDKIDEARLKFRISKKDTHPNDAGHKFMAQEIYNAYKKIYS